jgi:hypothetical protein
VPRDLRAPARTAQQNAKLAAVTPDDIEHARGQVAKDSPRLASMLRAEPKPGDDDAE